MTAVDEEAFLLFNELLCPQEGSALTMSGAGASLVKRISSLAEKPVMKADVVPIVKKLSVGLPENLQSDFDRLEVLPRAPVDLESIKKALEALKVEKLRLS